MNRFKYIHRILFIALFTTGFHFGLSQKAGLLSKSVSLQLDNKTIEEAIEALEKETGYRFSYASSSVDQTLTLSKTFTNQTIEEILNAIFSRYEISYVESGGVVLIRISSKKQKRKIGFGQIRGTLVDTSNEPIAFATVALKGIQKGVFTDIDGKFEMREVPKGAQILQVSYTGFETTEVIVSVRVDRITTINISLKESISQLQEVVVVGETAKAKLESSAQAVKVLELKTAKLKTADLGEVLARTKGVAIQRAGGLGSGTRISLNGLEDDQIRIFIDGIPVQSAGYTLDLANVPVGLIERVEVYKGVVPIQFGADALGGAINLVTSSNTDSGVSGSASYQYGSFGTNRSAVNFNFNDQQSGFFARDASFYDFARNDFKIDVEIPDERGRISEFTLPRYENRSERKGTIYSIF